MGSVEKGVDGKSEERRVKNEESNSQNIMILHSSFFVLHLVLDSSLLKRNDSLSVAIVGGGVVGSLGRCG